MTQNTVFYLSDPLKHLKKESLYLEVRRREGRLFSDDQVRRLPRLESPAHLKKEWRMRSETLERFCAALSRSAPLRVLDLGCGNGWMAHQLVIRLNTAVWAMDLNKVELEQGARVFKHPKLRFVYGDYLDLSLDNCPGFDLILLAASIQYFPDLDDLISRLRVLLHPSGRIHVLDSPFYRYPSDKTAPQLRSERYYEQLGVPEMSQYYHHHLLHEAIVLGVKDLNDSLKIKWQQKIGLLPPFPWLVFRPTIQETSLLK